MAKLHEILAVEGDLMAVNTKVIDEAAVTFGKKPDHFIGTVRQLRMNDDKDRGQDAEETKAMVDTVPAKLKYVTEHVVRYVDAVFQKDCTNQKAVADLVVDGATMATNVPATFLLGMETKLKQFREMCEAIPTLGPGKEWVIDKERGGGVWKSAHPEVRMKTAKELEFRVMVPATPEHAAQTKDWMADKPVGKITDFTWSGMLSPAEKSDLLGRIDAMLRAVKQARQRANNAEVDGKAKIGKTIFDYVLGTASASSSS